MPLAEVEPCWALQVTEPSRLAALTAKMDALRRWETNFNDKVQLLKKEETWFHKQAAQRPTDAARSLHARCTLVAHPLHAPLALPLFTLC